MNKFAYIALVFGVAQAHKLQSDFITDEQYAEQHAHALYQKANPMDDDLEEDHMVQLNHEDFITDDQYAAFHAKALYDKNNYMNDDYIWEDHLLQTETQIQFVDDAQWQFLSHDYLMTEQKIEESQGYVELPNCAADQYGAAAADPSRPQITGNNEKDGLDHANSDATCKPGTEWTNTVEAAGPPAAAAAWAGKATALGGTRPF